MATVYKAEQSSLNRPCALKIVNATNAIQRDPDFKKRFFLEASIASKLTHQNTVSVFDYGHTQDNIYYLAMEFLDGHTLHRDIRDNGPINEQRATTITKQICRSLIEAHALGIVHRDLKPTNIFLAKHANNPDFVKVLDFGLAKNLTSKDEPLTQAGYFMGSPKYLAPEQIRGDNIDSRTDIYALGIIMFEMATGAVPFAKPNAVHIMMAHVNDPPPTPRSINPNISISKPFETIILKCLEKNPNQRFPSMTSLLSALSEAARTNSLEQHTSDESHQSTPTKSDPTTPTTTHPKHEPKQPNPKHKNLTILAICATTTIAAGITYALLPPSQTSPQQSPTSPQQQQTQSTTIIIKTDPPGATVTATNGNTICNSTPCELTFHGDDATDGKTHKLTLTLEGHKTTTETITVSTNNPKTKLIYLARDTPTPDP